MAADEIESVFTLAEKNAEGLIHFEKQFKEEVKNRSYGFPYYVQLFGQLALDHTVKGCELPGKIEITKDHLIQGLKDFAEYEPKLEHIYLSVIGDDPARELLLKGLSIQLPNRISQSNVFQYCQKRGLENPKPVLSVLLSARNPQVIYRISDNFVCFCDPLFKIYACTRTPILIREAQDDYYG